MVDKLSCTERLQADDMGKGIKNTGAIGKLISYVENRFSAAELMQAEWDDIERVPNLHMPPMNDRS